MNHHSLGTIDTIYKGFILPNRYTWNRSFEGGYVKFARVFDENGKLFAKLYYSEGKLNGLCEFYENGVLVEKRTYVDDVADGWGCTIENGKEKQWFIYDNGIRISSIGDKDSEGFREEVSLESGMIISKFKYDFNHKPTGFGYLFENGVISKEVDAESGAVLKDYDQDIDIEYVEEITDIPALIDRVQSNIEYIGYVVRAGYSYKQIMLMVSLKE